MCKTICNTESTHGKISYISRTGRQRTVHHMSSVTTFGMFKPLNCMGSETKQNMCAARDTGTKSARKRDRMETEMRKKEVKIRGLFNLCDGAYEKT